VLPPRRAVEDVHALPDLADATAASGRLTGMVSRRGAEYVRDNMIRAGKHLYAVCKDCGKLVRMTGFFGGWHICA